MTAFVLLWGSAAIFTRWALDYSSVLALLCLRFGLALGVLLVLGLWRGRWLPEPGTRGQVIVAGLLLIGGYCFFFFQALANGITPGLLATILGIQPILTLLLTERRFSLTRLLGLILSLIGLVLVVYQSLVQAKLSAAGISFALAALLCMTFGAVLQKRIKQDPAQVLPLQYIVTLLLYACCVPFQSFAVEARVEVIVPVIYLGFVTSVVAQLLLYRLIRNGNLVNVTSLFYLVPVVTVLLDYLVFGNALPPFAIVGLVAIIAGLVLAFRQAKKNPTPAEELEAAASTNS